MIRVLPKGWRKVRLPQCCDIVSGSTPRRDHPEYWDGDIPWVTPKDLSGLDQPILHDTPEKITRAGYESCSATLMPKGAVLFSSRAPIGLAAIAGREMCTNQGFKSLVPGPDVTSEYLYWCMRYLTPSIQHMGRGATFKEVSKEVMERIEIPLPPLADQRRIAAILDKADGVRRKRKENIECAHDVRNAIFLDMFGDPREDHRGWERVRLGTILLPIEQRDPMNNPGQEFVYVDIASIDNQSKTIVSANRILGQEAPSRARKVICEGDVIVSTVRPNLNAVALVPSRLGNQICSTGFSVLRPSDKLTSDYIFAFVCTPYFIRWLMSKTKGANYPAVSDGDIKNVTLPLPPLSLQRKFTGTVEKICRLETAQAASNLKIDSLFEALLQRAFRGGEL